MQKKKSKAAITKKKAPKFRPMAIYLSGASEDFQRLILRALVEEEQKQKKREVINMNYPKGISEKELERFWGEPNPKEDAEFVRSLRAHKVRVKGSEPSAL